MLDAIRVDQQTKTIKPVNFEAEEFFGLAWGTNGTAAECRRALVTPSGYQWRRTNGAEPKAMTFYAVPTGCGDQ